MFDPQEKPMDILRADRYRQGLIEKEMSTDLNSPDIILDTQFQAGKQLAKPI